MSRVPGVVIAGAPRCGTTSLFSWLGDHPQVGASSVKETYFLMDDAATVKDRGRFERDGLAGYERFFSPLDGVQTLHLEATPGYLYQKIALRVLAEQLPEAKIIFLLRRPADRLLSTYRYFSSNWNDLDSRRIDFSTYVDLTIAADASLHQNDFLRYGFDHGHYVKWLERWVERCGGERIQVMTLEALRSDRRQEMARLASWCGIDPSFYVDYSFPKQNESYRVRSHALQRLNVWVRERLSESRLRDSLRLIYRKLNTSAPNRPAAGEIDQMQRLDALYADSNQQLAEQFNLDLSTWSASRRTNG